MDTNAAARRTPRAVTPDLSQPTPTIHRMEARLVGLPSRQDPVVRVDGDRILVDRLTLSDQGLAAWLAAQPMDDHAIVVERALRVGLTALQTVGVSLNVDAVRAEFDRLAELNRVENERAATALEQTLRTNFGDGDGRLPRVLEAFLGDKGKLRATIDQLFDPNRRDSAIGLLAGMLEDYFDGDASKLANLLDPTRLGSPLHQFRVEMTEGFRALHEKLAAIEAAASARAGERAKGTAKGGDFEDLLEALLGDVARGSRDLLERTGTDAGDAGRSKKGDFVITVDPELTRGSELRIVIEAKDRKVSGREMRDELREARTNRDAAIALVVFTPSHAPAGIAPFDVRAGDVYCVLDPADPDVTVLEAAVRLARLLAIASLREREAEVDAAAIGAALTAIREQLEAVRAMKVQLTSIGTTAGAVTAALDRMREGIAGQIARAERELATAG